MASDLSLDDSSAKLTSYQPAVSEERCSIRDESSVSHERLNDKMASGAGELKKKLGFVALYAYLVGGIVGSGIFVSPVKVIQTVSSGGMIFGLWCIGSIIAICGGLSYVELGSFVRNSGGEFAYIEKGFSLRGKKPFNVIGSLLSFSTIWTNILIIRPASMAIIMLTFAEYLVHLLRPFVPLYCEIPTVLTSLLAIAAIIVLGLINAFTQKGASVLMIVFTSIKLLSMGFIVVLGLSRLISGDTQTLSDTFHAPLKSTADAGVVIAALYHVFWAYEGWSNTAFFVEEIKTVKILPYAAALATVTVTVIYLSVNLAYLSVLSLEELDSLSGEAIAVPFAQKVIGTAGLIVIPLLVSISTFGSSNGNMFVASRITFSASRDGYLPSLLGGLHTKFATPIPAIILSVILASVYASIGSISELIDSFSAAVWVFYVLVFSSLLIMRITYRKEKRPFKVFFVVPLLMALVSLAVVVIPIKDHLLQSLGAFGGILLSVPVYFLFIYSGPLPKWMHCYKTMLSKLDAKAAQVVNEVLRCTPPLSLNRGLLNSGGADVTVHEKLNEFEGDFSESEPFHPVHDGNPQT